MSAALPYWLELTSGDEPLVVSIPHTGMGIPDEIAYRLASPWLSRKDTDWHVERLYDFAASLGATVLRTGLSRTVIDVNRDPSGASLYPGRATTELCPTTTFDGEPLYHQEYEPTAEEIASRRAQYFDPYHATLAGEVARLRATHEQVVVYDCHSIRSVIPRLFDGDLPHFNLGTNSGRSCDPRLTAAVEKVVDGTGYPRATNGRFKGGYITRHHGDPAAGVHALQMELAMCGYLHEEEHDPVDRFDWPPDYHPAVAAPMKATLRRVLEACLAFARSPRAVP